MMMTVVELVLGPDSDVQALRQWAAGNIRGGDGLVAEDDRIFLILPNLHGPQIDMVLKRLRPGAGEHGADLVVRPEGADEVADGVRRRAAAKVLPVEPRAPQSWRDVEAGEWMPDQGRGPSTS